MMVLPDRQDRMGLPAAPEEPDSPVQPEARVRSVGLEHRDLLDRWDFGAVLERLGSRVPWVVKGFKAALVPLASQDQKVQKAGLVHKETPDLREVGELPDQGARQESQEIQGREVRQSVSSVCYHC